MVALSPAPILFRSAPHAGLAGFFDLSQSGDRPVRWLDVLRLDTKKHGEYGPVGLAMLVEP
jgi:hypothetical protein